MNKTDKREIESLMIFKEEFKKQRKKRHEEDLEKRCDELEKELKFVKEVQTPDYERVQKELWEYQGAFEKSCVELSVGTGWFVNMPLEEIKEHFLK